MACGNGLRPDVWDDFKTRFQIPQIFEFYAATEGNVSLFNVEGEAGAIGRIPPYLAHRFSRDAGQIRCRKATSQFGMSRDSASAAPRTKPARRSAKFSDDASNVGSRFEGYTNQEASEKKILRDVFEPGDAWFRTGDLMRKDEQGFFYFVDRIGDTFRWKGENVSTSEVAEAICAFPGIEQANVYGVAIPGTDGRAGMAALVTDPELDLPAFRDHLIAPPPALRPSFVPAHPERDGSDRHVQIHKDGTGSPGIRSRRDHVRRCLFQRSGCREPSSGSIRRMFQRIQAGQLQFRASTADHLGRTPDVA